MIEAALFRVGLAEVDVDGRRGDLAGVDGRRDERG